MGTVKRVALYARVSTDQQSVRQQLDQLREVCARAGWQVAEEFLDQGISGAKGRTGCPAFDRMLKAATRREFDLVTGWLGPLGTSLEVT